MAPDADFTELWHKHTDLEFDEGQPVTYCTPAARFAEWADALIDRTSQNAGAVSINQAKVLLLDRYWAWYATVPRRHQDHIGRRSRHTCIYQVFCQTYASLRALELSITPPHIIEPSSLASMHMARIPALVLGELE